MSQGKFPVVFLRCFPFFRVAGGEWLPCAGDVVPPVSRLEQEIA